MKESYHWYSKTTGEIVENFSDVIQSIFECLFKFHFLNIRWKYSKIGF